MNVKDVFGLGPADQRVTIPVTTWVVVAVGLCSVAVALLLATGVTPGVAVPIGLLAGIVLTIPVATIVTVRRTRRTR